MDSSSEKTDVTERSIFERLFPAQCKKPFYAPSEEDRIVKPRLYDRAKLALMTVLFPFELVFAYFFFHFLLLKALCSPITNLCTSVGQEFSRVTRLRFA